MHNLRKKNVLSIIVVVIMMMSCQVFAYAAEEDNESVTDTSADNSHITNDVLQYFDWDFDALNSYVTHQENNVFSGRIYSISDIQSGTRETSVTVGNLTITSGLTKDRLTTFSSVRDITGTGVADTIVGVYVFHYESFVNDKGEVEEQLVPTVDVLSEIGRTGFYNETINIAHMGDNYVLLAVDGEIPELRLFKIVRKEEETKMLLENLKIDFYESDKKDEEPSIEEYIPYFFQK